MANVRYTVNGDPKPDIQNAAQQAGEAIVAKLKQYPPYPPDATYARTGALGESLRIIELAPGHIQVVTDATSKDGNLYGKWVYKTGTGIYSDRGSPIVPIRAKWLHWFGTLTGQHYFRLSVRGFEKWPNLEQAMQELDDQAKLAGWLRHE